MEKNVGKTDSIIRIILAVIIFFVMDNWGEGMQMILGVIAIVLVITAVSKVCFLYMPLKINTVKKTKQNLR
jgi:glucose uptake protein GlcU